MRKKQRNPAFRFRGPISFWWVFRFNGQIILSYFHEQSVSCSELPGICSLVYQDTRRIRRRYALSALMPLYHLLWSVHLLRNFVMVGIGYDTFVY